jgi:hypothetical protein
VSIKTSILGAYMPDEKSLDILGTKPLAKAVEKITDKSLDGIGAFFSAICMPAAAEFGLLLKDKVASFRKENLEAIANKAEEKIQHQKLEPTGDANPLLLRQIIEDASWTDDANMQSMWAGLLAVASSKRAAADDSIIYTDTLKRLTPFQARLINHIYSDPRCCSVKPPIGLHPESVFYPKNKLIYTAVDVLKQFPGDLSDIVPIAESTHEKILSDKESHGIAISRFRPQIEGLVTLGLIYEVHFLEQGREGVYVFPCLKGLDFYMRCLGYSVYPLEAFIVTQQHWCQLKGIDPFTYLNS